MNKKGFVGDSIMIVVSLFSIIIALLVIGVVIFYINAAFVSITSIPEGGAITTRANNLYPGIAESLVALFAVGTPLIATVLVTFLDISALFFWLIIVYDALLIIMSAALGNGLELVVSGVGNPLATVASNMPLTSWLMTHYAMYGFLVAALITAGMYFRFRQGP